MSILDFIPPGYILRPAQIYALLEIEKNWYEYDVFILDAPVATGKSLIAKVIGAWARAIGLTSAILTPRALLQDQYQRDFPELPSLKGKGRYSCKEKGVKTCADFHEMADFHCNGCKYVEERDIAFNADQVILNYHSHLFQGITNDEGYKDLLIIDEAHRLIPMLSEEYTLQIWKHKEDYGDFGHTKDDIIAWLNKQIQVLAIKLQELKQRKQEGIEFTAHERKKNKKLGTTLRKYKMIKDGLSKYNESFHISLRSLPYGRKRELHECIEVRPISLHSVPHKMWPDAHVKKLVLMSATIYPKDIERLGITRKRVKYITCESPIPVDNRPIYIEQVGSMAYADIKETTPKICARITELAEQYQGKGVVHLTYGLVKEFKKHLKGTRYLWHTSDTSEAVYNQFLKSKDNVILMACGMSEGIDLKGEEFKWQVIAKTGFPSLGDPLYQHFIKESPLIYTLEAVRTTVQQVGRICRTPSDYGDTYILDSAFAKFYKRSTFEKGERIRNFDLFPQYFKEAMVWPTIRRAS